MRFVLRVGLVAAALAAAAGTAAAHHSFAVFDMGAQKTVSGTVKKVDWTNPHIWIWLDVDNGKGGQDVFGFEGMSPNYLNRRGWTRTTLKQGDKIAVVYRPLKDGTNGGMFLSTRTVDGRMLTMGGGEPAAR